MKRRGIPLYACAALGVIALGLASRRVPGLVPPALGKYPGDALWALLAFLGWGIALPTASTVRVGALALATSWAVEFSQLYQAPWINAIRHTTLGHLILGSTFHWPDFVAYTAGVLLGATAESLVPRGVSTKHEGTKLEA